MIPKEQIHAHAQMTVIESNIKNGKLNPEGKHLYELACEGKGLPCSKPLHPPIAEKPNDYTEAAWRLTMLSEWLHEGRSYESFVEAFGPYPDDYQE